MVGMFWLTICACIEDFYFDVNFKEYHGDVLEDFPDQFILYFGLHEMTIQETMILILYFTFTSLSTVGLGDFHPIGNFERLACAIILMLGVAVFSAVMGIFIDILNKSQDYHADVDQGD